MSQLEVLFHVCDECHGNGEITLFAGNLGGGEPAFVQRIICPECKGKDVMHK